MTEIRDILRNAAEDVEEAEIPPELREVAFEKALELHAAGVASTESVAVTAASLPAADEALTRIAHRLDVDPDIVTDVYDESDGEVEVIVANGKIPKGAAPGTKDLAILVAAGRQGAGVEEWTPATVIRRVAEDYKRLDDANFSTTLKSMQNIFTFRGTPRRREVKMTRPAWDVASRLVTEMAGAP